MSGYGSTDRYDFNMVIEQSIQGQQEVIRAHSIMALARLDKLVSYFDKREKNASGGFTGGKWDEKSLGL